MNKVYKVGGGSFQDELSRHHSKFLLKHFREIQDKDRDDIKAELREKLRHILEVDDDIMDEIMRVIEMVYA